MCVEEGKTSSPQSPGLDQEDQEDQDGQTRSRQQANVEPRLQEPGRIRFHQETKGEGSTPTG